MSNFVSSLVSSLKSSYPDVIIDDSHTLYGDGFHDSDSYLYGPGIVEPFSNDGFGITWGVDEKKIVLDAGAFLSIDKITSFFSSPAT